MTIGKNRTGQSMDRSYKEDIPRYKKSLASLKRGFARCASTTDWTALRIEPLLAHVAFLERLLRSARFTRESTRLRKGVSMFHSDLVYLRANIKALKAILAAEHRRPVGKRKQGSAEPAGMSRRR